MTAGIPVIGQWYAPKDWSQQVGLAVAVLPSGEEVVLARPDRKTGRIIETVHKTVDLKGPMIGKRILPIGKS